MAAMQCTGAGTHISAHIGTPPSAHIGTNRTPLRHRSMPSHGH